MLIYKPIYKHHSSIQSWQVADLILECPVVADRTRMKGLDQEMYLCIPNHVQNISFISKFIVINFIPKYHSN